MSSGAGERWAAAALSLPALLAAGAVASAVQPLPEVATALALAALVASVGLLLWLAGGGEEGPERWAPWLWGLSAAALVGAGSWAEYTLFLADTRWWTVACHVAALGLIAGAGWSGGWVAGLRAAMVAHLGASAALLAVFGAEKGDPVQTAVFQASGLLDSYQASGGSNFVLWVTEATLGSVLPRTLGALVLGAALGAGAQALRRLRPKAAPKA